MAYEWMNGCSRSKYSCKCSQSQNMPVCHSECHCSHLDFHNKLPYVALPWDLKFCEPLHSEFWHFVTAPFWYHCFDDSPWDHMSSKLASPTCATVRVTLGSVQFSLLDMWDGLLLCFMEWDTPYNFHAFCAFWGSCKFYYLSIWRSWNPMGILHWKLIHEHLDFIVQSFLTGMKFCSFCRIFYMTRFYCSFMNMYRYSNKSPTRCNNFSGILLDVYLRLNMFRASSRPSSGAQQLP